MLYLNQFLIVIRFLRYCKEAYENPERPRGPIGRRSDTMTSRLRGLWRVIRRKYRVRMIHDKGVPIPQKM